MTDYLLLENGDTLGLEDGTGELLLESSSPTPPPLTARPWNRVALTMGLGL